MDRYQLSGATCSIFPHGRCHTFQLFLRNKSWVVKWSCRPVSSHTLLPGTKYAFIHIWTPANGDKWATANFRQALSLVLPTQNQICKYGDMWGWGEQLKWKFIGLSILTAYSKMSCLTKTPSNTKGFCEKFCCVSWPSESNPFSNLFLYHCLLDFQSWLHTAKCPVLPKRTPTLKVSVRNFVVLVDQASLTHSRICSYTIV